MAISDILAEAMADIEKYERDLPEAYGEPNLAARIARCKREMRLLMDHLNDPNDPPTPTDIAAAIEAELNESGQTWWNGAIDDARNDWIVAVQRGEMSVDEAVVEINSMLDD